MLLGSSLSNQARLSHTNLTSLKQLRSNSDSSRQKRVKVYEVNHLLRRYKIVINVSGTIYETFSSTLNKYPETLLGSFEKRLLLYNKQSQQIFINRSRAAFEAILFYYQSSGRLVCPTMICMEDFVEECYYYDISSTAIKSMKERENYLFKRRRTMPPNYRKIKHFVWSFFDNPKSSNSLAASFYSLFSYILVLMSIGIYCVETELLLQFKHDELKEHLLKLQVVEFTLNVFFATELLIRFIVNPWPTEFFFMTLNLVEAVSITLFLAFYACPYYSSRLWSFRISRILRSFRLVRISRLSSLVKAAVSVVQTSFNEVVAVSFVVLIVCILLGSTMYFVEYQQPNTDFTSIPNSMWWAIQTVLCVGYGDIIPTSVAGKLVGGVMLYIGVVCIAIMLLSLGGRIFDMYSKEISKTTFLPSEKVDYEIHYQ